MPSAMTLADLVSVPELGLTHSAGPEPGGQTVRWAHVTELVHPGPYLRGGEIVLTVGSALGAAAACAAFAAELAAAGVTALAFGVGDVHDEPPAALVAACRAHAIPLMTVPHGVPFQSLTELVTEHRIATRLAEERRGGHLVGVLLDAMAEGVAPETGLARVADELGGGLLVIDATGHVEAAVGDTSSAATASVDLPGGPAARLVWHAPVGEPDRAGSEALRELVRPLAVWRHERAEALLRNEQDLGRLVRLVIEGLAEPSALAGHLADPLGLVTATFWRSADAAAVRRIFPGEARAALDEGMVVFVTDAGAARALAVARRLPCGIGETVELRDVRRSVREAIEALNLSVRRGEPVTSAELATLDALLDRAADASLRPFVDQLLVPLAAHDAAAGSELLRTLRTFLDGGAAVVPVARAMFLHPNTLRHRLGRITELTGRNPLDQVDRSAFLVALRAGDRLPPRRGSAD